MKDQILPSHQAGIFQVFSNPVWLSDYFIGQLRCWAFSSSQKVLWDGIASKEEFFCGKRILKKQNDSDL